MSSTVSSLTGAGNGRNGNRNGGIHHRNNSSGMSHHVKKVQKLSDIPASFQMPTDILPTVPDSCLAEKGIKSQVPPSVLIVEDTKMCAKMLTMILGKFGCSTKWVENGKLAVDEMRTCTPGTYDLILMDLRMPVMDGLEATTLIKNELKDPTPVVALTGDFNEKTQKECEIIGFEDFRGKPMKRNDLKELIKQFTGYEVK